MNAIYLKNNNTISIIGLFLPNIHETKVNKVICVVIFYSVINVAFVLYFN